MNIYKDASKKEANYIVVPEGDLSNSEIALMPKAPTEKVYYEILFYKRLEDNDSIVSISSNLGDTTLILENLEIFGKSFRFLLGGGTLGNKDILQFTLTTKNGEQRELNVTVIIAPAGVAKAPLSKDYVIGDKGQKGDTGAAGAAATVTVGTTTTGDAGSKATVTNSGSTSAAV
ncbi:hypothetical protein, partial [Commensalibacter sp. Nvir]|uniref:phage fiber-tail adaptor protein n=1 Tax=Commensalibacter sp. Nvir TaxID=3069817 RepID=UPI0030C8AA3F